MKIGFIGAGNIGANAAKLFAKAGHEVAISNSRGPETLGEVISDIGENARAVSPGEAAGFGEVVFVSVPFGKYRELPAEALEGKIVIDSNNYYPDRDGNYVELDEDRTTSSELLAAHLAGARIVKAFNTIWFEHLKAQGSTDLPPEERRAIFIAGDDERAKETVAKLIDEIGFAAVDTGSLQEGGRLQQPGSAVYNRDLRPEEAENILAGKANVQGSAG
jgi:8-hydroxy-5-deazaflavin:NADPH oxidoreductase